MSQKPHVGQIVWMSCRATPNCEGKNAKIELLFPPAGFGGTTTRYVCQTCKRPFHITF